MTSRRSGPERPDRRRLRGLAALAVAGCAVKAAAPAAPSLGEEVTVDGMPLHFERLGSGPPAVLAARDRPDLRAAEPAPI